MEIPDHCFSNETLMSILEEKGLLSYDNATLAGVEITNQNYSDPNFNVSLCYDKLDDNQTHTFLHYETGNKIIHFGYMWRIKPVGYYNQLLGECV